MHPSVNDRSHQDSRDYVKNFGDEIKNVHGVILAPCQNNCMFKLIKSKGNIHEISM